MDAPKQTVGLPVPPPVLLLAALVVGLLLDWMVPLPGLSGVPWKARWVVGGVILVMSLIGFGGLIRFRQSGASPSPAQPVAALVTDGVFAYVRNPMYLGFGLTLLGLGVLRGGTWLVLASAALMVAIHFAVVAREERYLTDRFGQAYLDYMSRVRRYGLF
jgi:protein-S-isoprenylcysteine O-methyltransferase Ste14